MKERPVHVNGLLETCIHVANLENSARFYEAVFGFHRMAYSSRLCAFDVAGKGVLLLFQRDSTFEPVITDRGVIPPHGGSGDLHFALAIGADDLAAWETHLAQAGVALESRVRWEGGGESLYFRDLDHHLVELATPGVWPNY